MTGRGGGACILAKSSYAISIVPYTFLSPENGFTFSITLKGNTTLLVGVIYRPLSSPIGFHEHLCHLTQKISDHNSDFKILGGDFNFTSFTWFLHHRSAENFTTVDGSSILTF